MIRIQKNENNNFSRLIGLAPLNFLCLGNFGRIGYIKQ